MKKSIDIILFGKTYTLPFPNTSQFIDIQTLKAKLTEGYYDVLRSSGTVDGMLAAVICEAIATFNTLIGEQLKKDLTVPGLLSLELEQMIQLSYAYRDKYVPFYEEIMNTISNRKKEDVDAKTEAVA